MAQARLNLVVGQLEGAPALEVDGDVDFLTLDELRKAVRGVIEQGSEVVLLDLRNVTSIDTGAAGMLFNACRSLGPDRKLCAIARGASEQLLRKTRLDTMMYVVGDRGAAAELLKQSSGPAAARSVERARFGESEKDRGGHPRGTGHQERGSGAGADHLAGSNPSVRERYTGRASR